jgi:hypothetical protein
VGWLAAGIHCDLFDVGENTVRVVQFVLFSLLLVEEDNRQSTMNEGDIFQVLPDGFRIELRSTEDFDVGPEENERSPASEWAQLFHRT